jgi:hypothetical protein
MAIMSKWKIVAEPAEGLPESTTDETCPWCGESIGDLWDYNWQNLSGQSVKTDCGNCEKPIEIEAEYSVTYTIAPAEGK